MQLSDRLRTTLEIKLDVIKEYYDSANDTACALWTYVLTFKPYLPHALLGEIVPSIRITEVDTETNTVASNTLDDVMSNTTNTTKLNWTYKDNSITVTGSGGLDLIMFGSLIPVLLGKVIIKAKCQGTEYKWTVPYLDPTSVDTITQATALMAYPTFIHE